MSINNSFYVRIPDEERVALNQNLIDRADPSWNNFIKISDANILSKIKNAILNFFGSKPAWISIRENISIRRDLIETLEVLDLTDMAGSDILSGKTVNSVFNKIYSKLLKFDNLDKMEKIVTFLKKNYELIDADTVKSNHISKALSKKNKPLLTLISLINSRHYLTYLKERKKSLKNPLFKYNDSNAVILLRESLGNPWIK